MKYVVGSLLIVFGFYVSVMNIHIAITAGKTKAINKKKYSSSRIPLFDFMPIVIGLPFVTNFSLSMNTYILMALPLAMGLPLIEQLAYCLTFRIVKRKNDTLIK